MVSSFFRHFDAPLALVIGAATPAGLLNGALVGPAYAGRRWRHRPAGSALSDAGARDRSRASIAAFGTRISR